MLRTALATALALLLACGEDVPARPSPPDPATSGGIVRLLFGGDVMLGRGVEPVVRNDPWSIFADARPTLTAADLTIANLESPLTRAPHAVGNVNHLEALPRAARVLRAAGFDAMSVANNHAGDAGPRTVIDTTEALRGAGIEPVGLDDGAPVMLTHGGLRIALLAFDASPPRLAAAGVAPWDRRVARGTVRRARRDADLVAVSLHGGLDYRPDTDDYLWDLGIGLARWGADVVWGHGPHVAQPVRVVDPDGDGRSTALATSLGNLVFDAQGIPGTDRGSLMEVRADGRGVIAVRVGEVPIRAGRVGPVRWVAPEGDAVAFDGGWWRVARTVVPADEVTPVRLPTFPGPPWQILDAASGDVDGDGRPEVVLAFRRPFSPGPQMRALPDHRWTDARGWKAVVGVYAQDLTPRWVSSSVLRPVADVVVCGPALVVATTTLGDPRVVGTGLWPWRGFGFTSSVDLPGPGRPGCADVDGDGVADPVVTGRSER